MRTGARLAAFAAVLGLTLGAAALVGAGVAPVRDDHGDGGHGGGGHGDGHGAEAATATEATGLAVAGDGLRLVAARTIRPPGDATAWTFRVVDADGATVRDFDVEHERRMHLVVVRRDLTGYQHLHPRQGTDGAWTVPLRLTAAGVHRVYADFTRDGRGHTLAVDVMAGGEFTPVPLPAVAPLAPVTIDVDGERQLAPGDAARLTALHVAAGRDVPLIYDITREGRPVEGIEPYLGADGHLVALREGDLAFLHVHPEESDVPGRIRFRAELPSAGRYRLFLQFRHDGVVRTVAHTLAVPR